jgi:Transglutaminase-like superfamily
LLFLNIHKLIFAFCLLCFISAKAQELSGDIINVKTNTHLDRKNQANAIEIINQLTKYKTSDKDKFDVIFSWVAKNINYNINSFYTATNSGPEEIKKILEKRNTICLGYAQLMDTLCELAGITNVTVFGYAKDMYYDVNDSIYGHNHAWNAVKLDNLWYVYDVTWSNGVTDYVLTNKSKLITKLLAKFPEKYKKKKIKIPRKFRYKSFCKEKIEPAYYYKRRFFNTLLRNRLSLLTITVLKKYFKGISTNYYLSNPELFSASHVPDDPI